MSSTEFAAQVERDVETLTAMVNTFLSRSFADLGVSGQVEHITKKFNTKLRILADALVAAETEEEQAAAMKGLNEFTEVIGKLVDQTVEAVKRSRIPIHELN